MAWFPWRKKSEEVDVPQPVTPPATPAVAAPAPVVEPAVVEPIAEPVLPEPIVMVPIAVEPAVVAQPVVVEPVIAPEPAGAPAPGAVWNATVGGVVVTIDASEFKDAGAATAVREGIEQALALAVGPDSPAPTDASEDFPIVLAITVAQDAADDVHETIAAARKQLARKAGRVRLVVDEV